MATVNFLYRSTKDKANLHLRLLYRFNETDFVFGANTKYEVSKLYWSKQHKIKSKDILVSNKQTEVNNELNKIENHVLNAFNTVNTDEVNKEWLQTQIDYYYNPPQEAEQLPTELLKYFDYFIEAKKNEITIGTQKKYNVTKHLLERYQKTKSTQIKISDVNDKFKVESQLILFQLTKREYLNTQRSKLTYLNSLNPLYDLVNKIYKPHEIILLCGEDIHQCDYAKWLQRGHNVFVREL